MKKVEVGDAFIVDGVKWWVKEPYKVRGHWKAANNEGETRIFSGGTVAIFRVAEKNRQD